MCAGTFHEFSPSCSPPPLSSSSFFLTTTTLLHTYSHSTTPSSSPHTPYSTSRFTPPHRLSPSSLEHPSHSLQFAILADPSLTMAPRRSFESAKDGSGKATNSSYIHLQSSVSAGEESANTATSNDLWSNGRAEPSNMVPANQHAGIEAPAAPVIVHSSNGGSGEPSALQIQPPEPQHQSSPSPTDSGVGSMVTNGTMISANISLSQQEQSIGHYFKIDNHQMRELDGGLAIRIFHCVCIPDD
ncbi:hypothetical protein K431DRAFT_109098 [Polychaeton citri CBS 116435]|uniref:Uncharacterized protein n=1 Tax=Polychaeton citri CBS 116435 TaxID=1314669 RepID=A0A9P4Q4G6_9PEZI|nr:hypothetical protein K431DRAFT_109098 [Polychaeton citri CBS 116435]